MGDHLRNESHVAPLDDIDRVLMRELAADGRATLAALADKAGLSVSAVQSRVRRLEARKVIRGYTAKVDPEALGNHLSAFVSITPVDPSHSGDIPGRLRSLRAIEACHAVTGKESFMLLVRVPSPKHLEQLLQEIRLAANVHTRSTIILDTFFEG
ncbi:MAG: Lrp/AsnC family transcriptional regulator [Rhodococcus sp.]|nr:Lrp/AsnC family transcriptional regulator [Rhodococcus sp. (in: high G+C Gram-positive bacteria)]